MVLLESADACTRLCSDLGATLGPATVQIVATVGGLVLVWYRGRKQIGKVEEKAEAGIAAANAQASKAKTEARAAAVQLAEIKGSLRPVTVAGTGSSGLFEPVVMPGLGDTPRPSSVDPSLLGGVPLPAPSGVPRPTPPETPSSKRGGGNG